MRPSKTPRNNNRNIRRSSTSTLLAYLLLWTSGLREDNRKTKKKTPHVVPDSRNHASGVKASFGERTGTMHQGQAGKKKLVRAQPGMTKNSHTQHTRRWTKFQDMLDKAAFITSEPGLNKSTMRLGNLGTSLTSPDSLAPEDVCSTCSAPGAWVAEGCSLESGAFGLTPATRLDPTRWRSQCKHAMKCNFLRNLPTQAIKQDHILDEACHLLGWR